jgi:hypothetical protein
VRPVNSDPTRVHVYSVNVENLPQPSWSAGCRGHAIDLVRFLAAQSTAPDILTVQQLSGRAQAQDFADLLYQQLGSTYAFEVAVDNPRIETNSCSPYKDYQTNAIFWRTGRFQLVAGSKQTWQARVSTTPGSCPAGSLNNKDRSISVAVKLRDNLPAGFKFLPVVSIHFPQVDEGCMTSNITEALDRAVAMGGGLRLVAGDVNYRDRTGTTPNPWWSAAHNSTWRDLVYAACAGDSGCLDAHWTNVSQSGNQNRIDFVWAQKLGPSRPAVTGVDTISYAQARAAAGDSCGLDYSGHRAIRGFVAY